jgi:type IV secretory pathway TraG/TraD family ATPase VirD4
MPQPVTSQPALVAHPSIVQQAQSYLFSPLGLILICGTILMAVSIGGGKPKGKLANAYWGGATEKSNAQKKGKAQLKSPKVGSTTLYINTPASTRRKHRNWVIEEIEASLRKRGIEENEIAQKLRDAQQSLPPKVSPLASDRTIFFPDVQAGAAVFGAAGTGKSFGVLNPFLRSAIDQGLSVILWDFKYREQAQEIAGYAKERGYNVQIFAPSFPESSTLNLLDFIADSGDSAGAKQIAETFIKNSSSGDRKGGNDFFENAGSALVQGVFLAAKWIGELEDRPDLADLMMSASILNLPNLSARLKFATKRLNVWNAQVFAQLISSSGGKETNVTESGIIATAQKVFQQFVQRDFVPALCGTSDFKPDIEGKTLVIVGLNQDYRDALTPILATVLDTLISRNIAHARKRKTPLVASLDELPSIYLPKIANWLAEARSAGFVGLLGLQNQSQLKEAYGEDRARTILANCGTKFFLNPQDDTSAKQYSDYLGEKDVKYWTKSTSSSGGQNGRSTSKTEQIAKAPLMEAAEFLKLPQGKAVCISPGYKNSKEAYVPILRSIKVQQEDIDSGKRSVTTWQKMLSKMATAPISDLENSAMLEERRAIAERLLPEPPSDANSVPLSYLIKIAVRYLGYETPLPDSYIDDNVSIYERWMTVPEGGEIDLSKIERDLELLMILLGSHGITLTYSDDILSTKEKVYA